MSCYDYVDVYWNANNAFSDMTMLTEAPFARLDAILLLIKTRLKGEIPDMLNQKDNQVFIDWLGGGHDKQIQREREANAKYNGPMSMAARNLQGVPEAASAPVDSSKKPVFIVSKEELQLAARLAGNVKGMRKDAESVFSTLKDAMQVQEEYHSQELKRKREILEFDESSKRRMAVVENETLASKAETEAQNKAKLAETEAQNKKLLAEAEAEGTNKLAEAKLALAEAEAQGMTKIAEAEAQGLTKIAEAKLMLADAEQKYAQAKLMAASAEAKCKEILCASSAAPAESNKAGVGGTNESDGMDTESDEDDSTPKHASVPPREMLGQCSIPKTMEELCKVFPSDSDSKKFRNLEYEEGLLNRVDYYQASLDSASTTKERVRAKKNLSESLARVEHYASLAFWSYASTFLTRKELAVLLGREFKRQLASCDSDDDDEYDEESPKGYVTWCNVDEHVFMLPIRPDNIPECIRGVCDPSEVEPLNQSLSATYAKAKAKNSLWKFKVKAARALCEATQAVLGRK